MEIILITAQVTPIRWCPKCFQWHAETDFRLFKAHGQLYRKRCCRNCELLRERQRKENWPNKITTPEIWKEKIKKIVPTKEEWWSNFYDKNKERIKKRTNDYYNKNKALISEKNKKYRERNSKIIKERKAEYYKRNRGSILEKDKINRKTAEATLKRKEREKRLKTDPAHKIWVNNYNKKRRSEDIEFKILGNLRNRIKMAIKHKSNSTKKLLGCEIVFFIDYIQSKFTPEMNWDNYGKFWSIDHIIPCRAFDLNIQEHQEICFNYRNCRPIESSKNSMKGASEDKRWDKITDLESIRKQIFGVKEENSNP